MLDAYSARNERLTEPVTDPEGIADAVWIDLLQPTREEETLVERLIGLDIPTREEMAEIEVSSRLYRENDALYMTATLIAKGDDPIPESCPVTFILAGERLVTVRYGEPSVFKIFMRRAQKADFNLRTAGDVLAALLEAIIDRSADILEKAAADIDAVSRNVFRAEEANKPVSRDFKAVLKQVGRSGDLTSRVRESLVSLGRLVNFLNAECGDARAELRERTETMRADIRSLTDHASYVASTTVFLLDATLGLINIEQNAIIKIVSVVSVLIMPPTLVASIYGMNFRFMPELDWPFGYPLALAAMVLAAVVPYWLFKRRGWL